MPEGAADGPHPRPDELCRRATDEALEEFFDAASVDAVLAGRRLPVRSHLGVVGLMSPPRRWEDLSTLLGAYFHQDFSYEHGSPADVLRDFKLGESDEIVGRAAEQALDFARAIDDEEVLQKALDTLGSCYASWADGWQTHEWLEHVAATLRP